MRLECEINKGLRGCHILSNVFDFILEIFFLLDPGQKTIKKSRKIKLTRSQKLSDAAAALAIPKAFSLIFFLVIYSKYDNV